MQNGRHRWQSKRQIVGVGWGWLAAFVQDEPLLKIIPYWPSHTQMVASPNIDNLQYHTIMCAPILPYPGYPVSRLGRYVIWSVSKAFAIAIALLISTKRNGRISLRKILGILSPSRPGVCLAIARICRGTAMRGIRRATMSSALSLEVITCTCLRKCR